MKHDIRPPAAQPTTPPPIILTTPAAKHPEQNYPSYAWAYVVFILGICTIIAASALYAMHLNVEAGAIKANAELLAATVPTTMSFDCEFAINGNFQMDGREVNVSKQMKPFKEYNDSRQTYQAFLEDVRYPGTNIRAENINVPDFTQLRINTINAHCSGNAQLPARLLAEATK